MLHLVKKVEYVEEYNLKLHFDDGSIKLVNLENMLKNAKNMFLPLLDVNYFKKVKCDGTTICWPNGLDLCPDVLFKMGRNFKPLKVKLNQTTRVLKSRKRPKVNSD